MFILLKLLQTNPNLLKNKTSYLLLGLFLCLLFGLAAQVHINTWNSDTTEEDIYYAWVEGQRIVVGENPYARILQGNMRQNDKYATYFPLFYELSALSQSLGWESYAAWIGLWRGIFLLFHLGCGGLIFAIYARKQQWATAVLTTTLWLFNNWGIWVSYIAHLDVMPIFCLLLSLYWLQKRPFPSLLALSFSLALKQLAVFLLPLYAIWLWQAASGPTSAKLKKLAGDGVVIGSIPFVASMPFLWWSAEGFIKSVSFSATRYAANLSAMYLLGINGGLVSRLPVVLLIGCVCWLAWEKKVGPFTAVMLTMLSFTALTPVLFPQYLLWLVALLLLVPADGWRADPVNGYEP